MQKMLLFTITLLYLVGCSNNSEHLSQQKNDIDDEIIEVKKLGLGEINIIGNNDSEGSGTKTLSFRVHNVSTNNGRVVVEKSSSLPYLTSSCPDGQAKTIKGSSYCDYKILVDESLATGNYPITLVIKDTVSQLNIASYFMNYYHNGSSIANDPTNIINSSLCKVGFHMEGRTCKNNIKPLSPASLSSFNALSGYQSWDSQTFTYINNITACLPNYSFVSATEPCELATIPSVSMTVSGLGAVSMHHAGAAQEVVCGDTPWNFAPLQETSPYTVDSDKNCEFPFSNGTGIVVRGFPARGHFLKDYVFPDCTQDSTIYSNEVCSLVFQGNVSSSFNFEEGFHKGYSPRFNASTTNIIRALSNDDVLIGATGTSTYNNFSVRSLFKLNKINGDLDVSYMDKAYIALGGSGGSVTRIEPADNEIVYVAGAFPARLSRLLPNGELDTSFNFTYSSVSNIGINNMHYNKQTKKLAVYLFQSSASVYSFNVNGTNYTDIPSTTATVLIINENGSLDKTYSLNFSSNIFYSGVNQMELLNDDSLLLSLRNPQNSVSLNGHIVPSLIKITNTGVIDTNFTDISTASSQGGTSHFTIDDNYIYVAYQQLPTLSSFKGNAHNGIIKMTHNGTFVKTFGVLKTSADVVNNKYIRIIQRDSNSLYLLPVDNNTLPKYNNQLIGNFFIVDKEGDLIPTPKLHIYGSLMDSRLTMTVGVSNTIPANGALYSRYTTDKNGNLFYVDLSTTANFVGDLSSTNPEFAIPDPINGILKVNATTGLQNKDWIAKGSYNEAPVTDAEYNSITQKWVLATGWTSPGTSQKFQGYITKGIVQLNDDGSVDKNFLYKTMYHLKTNTGFNNGGTSNLIEIQSDGKIILSHATTFFTGITYHEDSTLIGSTWADLYTRFHPDGAIDLTYLSDLTNGKYVGRFTGTSAKAVLMKVLPDDSLVIAHNATLTSTSSNGIKYGGVTSNANGTPINNRLFKVQPNGLINLSDQFNVNMIGTNGFNGGFVNTSGASVVNKFRNLILTKNNKLILVGNWREARLQQFDTTSQSNVLCPVNICVFDINGKIQTDYNTSLGVDPFNAILNTNLSTMNVVEMEDSTNDPQDTTDNGFIMVGNFETYKGTSVGDVITLDSSMNLTNTLSSKIIATGTSVIRAVSYDKENKKIYIAGEAALQTEVSPGVFENILNNSVNSSGTKGVVKLTDELALDVDRSFITFNRTGTIDGSAPTINKIMPYNSQGAMFVMGQTFLTYNQTNHATDPSHNLQFNNILLLKPNSIEREP